MEFNDRDYQPLSWNGGHGKIGFWISEGFEQRPVALGSRRSQGTAGGQLREKRNRATGDYARPGYLPPCSGGRGHSYFAEVKAVKKIEGKKKPKVLGKAKIKLGRY